MGDFMRVLAVIMAVGTFFLFIWINSKLPGQQGHMVIYILAPFAIFMVAVLAALGELLNRAQKIIEDQNRQPYSMRPRDEPLIRT